MPASDLIKSMHIAASGMRAQSDRLRIVSQNIANAESVGTRPGEAPYRRKVLTFKNTVDRELEAELVRVGKYGYDDTPFKLRYDPNHPAADDNGYVKLPNVNTMIEMMDMREARRGYEANLNVIEVSKGMIMQTINMLR
ncbi:MAG: flagellar basal body rod protein FlgC [Rickettsiales bacterium]|nr:flagellar basal body rod protein FlgC [Rickettsiales bacterium]